MDERGTKSPGLLVTRRSSCGTLAAVVGASSGAGAAPPPRAAASQTAAAGDDDDDPTSTSTTGCDDGDAIGFTRDDRVEVGTGLGGVSGVGRLGSERGVSKGGAGWFVVVLAPQPIGCVFVLVCVCCCVSHVKETRVVRRGWGRRMYDSSVEVSSTQEHVPAPVAGAPQRSTLCLPAGTTSWRRCWLRLRLWLPCPSWRHPRRWSGRCSPGCPGREAWAWSAGAAVASAQTRCVGRRRSPAA